MDNGRFSPKEFLRSRRPERFSDSLVVQSATIDRVKLEYHLDTITNRNQEVAFERFARRLAEHVICPNLMSHTGPTGGGDSKVDTETFPVADQIADTWFVGAGREAASERWAFAFSAKKDWRSKVQSDVAKVVATERRYVKLYFVTNQFVRDKVRGELQDDLQRRHSIEVWILDRTWILDRVFEHGLESLVTDELGVSPAIQKGVRPGPLDLQRSQQLEEIEERIAVQPQESGGRAAFVADCIEAAGLARSLEKPVVEVEGRYLRAERAAAEHGTAVQQLRVAYDQAWTAYWWLEDLALFTQRYGAVEARVLGSESTTEIELLVNLWMLLAASVRRGEIDEVSSAFPQRTATVTEQLSQLSANDERPTAALNARSMLLLVQLILTREREEVAKIVCGLDEVVSSCDGLIGFPFEPLAQGLMEVAPFLNDLEGFDKLIDHIVEVTERRKGEVAGGRMLLSRGAQLLDSGRPYEAIRNLGKALRRLYKHESRELLVRALYLCSKAYERGGLFWAARGTMLNACWVATQMFSESREVLPEQAACYAGVKWIELRLGRIAPSLAWREVEVLATAGLSARGFDAARDWADHSYDPILGICFLRADVWTLRKLERLPDMLHVVGLEFAELALRYALGYESGAPEELGWSKDPEKEKQFFRKWRDQPASADLPRELNLYEQRTIELTAHVLGCRIVVDTTNNSSCVALAESVLAAIESLLSTTLGRGVFAHEPQLSVRIRHSDLAEAPFESSNAASDGRVRFEVLCREFSTSSLSRDEQATLKSRILDLVVAIICTGFAIPDADEVLPRLLRDEQGLERALDFTGSFVIVGAILGENPKTVISSWQPAECGSHPLLRKERWDFEDEVAGSLPIEPEPGEPNTEGHSKSTDLEGVTHRELRVLSPIRVALWDSAGWFGTGFVGYPNNSAPPVLFILFKNETAGAEIFKLWREQIGEVDEREQLRISIVRSIDIHRPHSYRIAIGPNPRGMARVIAHMWSRVHRMDPDSDLNLQQFLASWTACGAYVLAPATIDESRLRPLGSDWIQKRELNVRDAWNIGRNDLDCVAIAEDDEPVIPLGQTDPPVLDLLARRKRRGQD